MKNIQQQLSAIRPTPVFAIIHVEGCEQPVFKGLTALPFTTERTFRALVLQMFPQVRKASIAAIGVQMSELPKFVRDSGGKFLFSATMKQELAAPTPKRVRAAKPKKKAKKKKLAKKPLSRSKAGHSTRKAKPKKAGKRIMQRKPKSRK